MRSSKIQSAKVWAMGEQQKEIRVSLALFLKSLTSDTWKTPCEKHMETPGFDPGASRMRSARSAN
jgi:hypothetical protein